MSREHSFSKAIEDCFADTQGHLESPVQDASSPEAPSIEHGNKMLSFLFPSYHCSILDSSRRQTSLSLTAQLHGMFFLAESSRAGSGDGMMPPVELTCYRRNLFQITGCITLPQMMRYVLTEQGDQIPILAQELSISATESVEGHPIKIISVPWKTPAAGTSASTPEDKTEKEPASISLQKMDHFTDGDYAKFPIEWKRLQFRVATANNGRRKELQQHFTIKLSVNVTLATGDKVTVCEALSGPIIVRGRSPRNFQTRRDYPLSGTGGSMRKAMQSSSSRQRTASPEHLVRRPSSKSKASPTVSTYSTQSSPHLSQSPHVRQTGGDFDWSGTPTGLTSTIQTPIVTRTSKAPDFLLDHHTSSPEPSNGRRPALKRKASTPDPAGNISYSNYETSLYKRAASAERAHSLKTVKPSRTLTAPSESLFLPFNSSNDYPGFSHSNSYMPAGDMSNVDIVNKYFPVGVEDWMPPVESIYKHQGFQHMNQPSMMAVGEIGGRRGHKRYMSDGLI
ncbi:MAG: hypothetical protein Q9187_006764 [Circinaria calcarea]